MRARHDGRFRIALATGVLFGVIALCTDAAFVDEADVHVTLDGALNRFDIVAAGSPEPGWTPTDASWVQGNPDAYRIRLTPDDSTYGLAPGEDLNVRVAAKNASPRLASLLTLTIRDPVPRGDAIDRATGRYVDLWDQLVFTVRQGTQVLFDRVNAPDLTPYTWPAALAPGDYELLDVTIQLSETADNRWQSATTDVQFNFEAVNA